MAFIASDALSRTTHEFTLDQPLQLGGVATPLMDMVVREGVMKPKIGGTAYIPIRIALEAGQNLAMYAAANAATADLNASVSCNFYRRVIPAMYDTAECGNQQRDEVKLAIERGNNTVTELIQDISTAMHQSDFNGQSDAAPFVTFRNAFPFNSTGTYFGLDKAVTTGYQHMYAGITAGTTESAVFGATYAVTDFSDPDTGLMHTIDMAKLTSAARGGSRFVCFCTSAVYGHIYTYLQEQQGIKAETSPKAVPWLSASNEQAGMRVAEFGFDTYYLNNILFVHDPGISSSFYDCIMFPLRFQGSPNLQLLYNIDEKSNEFRGKKLEMFYAGNWVQKPLSFTYQMLMAVRMQLIILAHQTVFVGKFNGNYQDA